ncbi:ABC transporter ATP-binding protein [Halegenticoccus tardaugens]|uniref:ABC transporter ATP-binding protein n=1 Tax=Halegenticoccus tardaugens TaxID=2071624 RepID=UPI00100BA482|nr:ABC transporter ATP-binding protein [Halegenticoccus tardaugens]
MGNVKLEDVTKRYGDVTAVDDMNMHVKDGEFVCLVGPSGCGKSTTMETIAGLTMPTEGDITIGGTNVTHLPPKDRGVAMVFQNIALFPHMDVYDNMSFGLRLRNFDTDETDRRVERAADILQIKPLLDRKPSELSGGQRQRVAIGRAIVREPETFLMDEPLANLDAKLRVHMRTELQRLHKELQTTIIYVTHDQAEAMTMSDRIAVLNVGELQQIDPPLTCYNEPANLFVAGFIGSPSMNFIEGEITADGFDSEFVSIEFDPVDFDVSVGTPVTLGVRPEDVYLADDRTGVPYPTKHIDTVTDVMEPMGDEIFVYLLHETCEPTTIEESQHHSNQLLMSIDPATEISEEDHVAILFDRTKLHLFDQKSGEAISHGLETAVAKQTATQPPTSEN